MPERQLSELRERESSGRRAVGPVTALGVGAVAVLCCAGLPAIAAAVGGLTFGALLGIAAGFAALSLGAGTVMFARARRRRPRGLDRSSRGHPR